jgi:uncharacterized protein YqcC (DUF446 family)
MIATLSAEKKVNEITDELKLAGLWKKNMPQWVTNYEDKMIASSQDFLEWLQFIYLPNFTKLAAIEKKYIVPQAVKFFGEDVKKGRLLQLLVELDSLL